jgi:hypothetical protein
METKKEITMKHCAGCGLWKEDNEFNWRWKLLGVRQNICRGCSKVRRREHYQRYQESENARSYEITKNRREEADRYIDEYLSYQVCADCGEYDLLKGRLPLRQKNPPHALLALKSEKISRTNQPVCCGLL